MGRKLLNLRDGVFEVSAVEPAQYPRDTGPPLPEIALVGRSNVGKSSLLNCLANRRDLAKTSSRPGKTQTINFYKFGNFRMVDLPGYGYAEVSKRIRAKWGPMIETYLREREQLVGVIHIVDLRHKPTQDDVQMSQWLQHQGMPYGVIATKADKISRGKWQQHAKMTKEVLGVEPIIFSAQTAVGKAEVLALLAELLGFN
ncbi:MAG TPA: YihA family ribosome biogenesis GTP-binding protein [Firmicutes bacterium]|nr:YihA family ribosome biogenesis GTP-binding protein [Bacillota bacterium]